MGSSGSSFDAGVGGSWLGLRPLWTTMSSYSSWGQRGQAEGLRQLPPCPLPKFPHPPWEPGAASKPEVPAPKSKSQLLVLSPPLPRSPVFSRPAASQVLQLPQGGLPLCPTSLCLYPNSSTPASQRQPLPTVMSRRLGSPRKPLPRWLRSFPTTASVRITAAQGHLPAACVLPLLLPEKKSPAAILCCLSLPTTTTEVFSLSLLEFCLCHCLHFSPTGARAPPTTPVQVSPDTACTAA